MNFSSDEGQQDITYGENYDRLAELKAEYDPTNLFRMNRNVEPTD